MKLNEIVEMEARVSQMLSEIKAEITSDINNQHMEGVNVVTENPRIVTVNFSQLSNTNLSPNYYIPAAQAELVAEGLKSAQNVTEFINRLKQFAEKKSVTISGNRMGLNAKTISVITHYLEENC